MDLLKCIRLGIRTKDFFPYDNQMLPIRALSSMELDECNINSMSGLDNKLTKLIMNIKLGRVDLLEDLKTIPNESYISISKYYNELDYWIVYHGMKDFQDGLTIDDVRLMHSIHDIADKIISLSSVNEYVIREFVNTPEGEDLAEIIYMLKVPLISEAWKMTPLQHSFLIYSNPNQPQKVADSWDELKNKTNNGEIVLGAIK